MPDLSDVESYNRKIQEEIEQYKAQLNIHELPEIFHYWSHKHLLPLLNEAGIKSEDQFFASNLYEGALRCGVKQPRFVSIGSGNCDREIGVARQLKAMGLEEFIIECLELNPTMLARGKEIASNEGLEQHMQFLEADFNTWTADKEYHGVMANQSLHHVTELEFLFSQIKESLHEEAHFVIADVIGRNGHQRWPEALEIVNKYWKTLSEKKRYNVLLNRHEEQYENWDCSDHGFEGIRAQDILPLLLQDFKCKMFLGFGNVIDIFIDRAFGHHYSADDLLDRIFIDALHREDEEAFKTGLLKPTHMRAVWAKSFDGIPFYSRNISPEFAVRNP